MAFLKHKVFVSSLTFPGQHFNGSFEIFSDAVADAELMNQAEGF